MSEQKDDISLHSLFSSPFLNFTEDLENNMSSDEEFYSSCDDFEEYDSFLPKFHDAFNFTDEYSNSDSDNSDSSYEIETELEFESGDESGDESENEQFPYNEDNDDNVIIEELE